MRRIFTGAFLFLVSMGLAVAEIFTSSIPSAEANMPVQHASSIVELDEGSLLVTWYGGSKEAARDTQIFLRRSTSTGVNWEPTQIAVKPHEIAAGAWFANKTIGNPVLFQDQSHRVWLIYGAVEFGGWSGARVDYKTSDDDGRTWSGSRRLSEGLGNLPRAKPLLLGGCDFLLPLSHSAIRKYPYTMRWNPCGKVLTPVYSTIDGPDCSHASLARTQDDRIFAFLRARGGGKVRSALFDREKNKWNEPRPTNLPNPDSPVDSVVLDDNRILLAYNDSGTVRNPLALAVSQDGIIFEKVRDVENEAGGDFSYPALIRARDGTFYLTYTWHYRSAIKCIHFDSGWLNMAARDR